MSPNIFKAKKVNPGESFLVGHPLFVFMTKKSPDLLARKANENDMINAYAYRDSSEKDAECTVYYTSIPFDPR